MRQVYKALSSHASSADAVRRTGYSSNFQGARSDTCTEARRGAATLLLETKRVPATGHVVENAMLLVTPMLSMFCRLCRATDQAQVGPSSLTVHYPSSYFDPEIILLYFSPGRVCRRSGNTMGNALGWPDYPLCVRPHAARSMGGQAPNRRSHAVTEPQT